MINVSGVSDSRIAPAVAYFSEEESQSIVLVPTYVRAQRLALDLSFFVKDKKILVLPEEEQVFLRYEARNHDQLIDRMKALKALRTGEPVIVIAPVSAAVKKISPHNVFEEKVVKMTVGEEIEICDLRERLISMGYEFSEMVESQGQFSIRGGIIDIFTPDNDVPYRTELFGTEIDSIRTFNQDTQRSIENLKFIEVYPAKQLITSKDSLALGCMSIRREYESHAKRLENKKPEISRKLIEVKNQICEYIENISNVQYL